MDLHTWSSCNADYSLKLLDSGLQGARSGREAFLKGKPLAGFLDQWGRNALKHAAVGACMGVLGSYQGKRHVRVRRALAYGFLGGAIGFCLGMAWESRPLAASVGSAALRNMGKVRDEHWLERHPIDYA